LILIINLLLSPEFEPHMCATASISNSIDNLPRRPELPPRLRILFIASAERVGGWLVESFVAEAKSEVILDEVMGSVAGLSRLREELYDLVLVSYQPGNLDALELLEGYRTGVADSPLIVLGTQSEQEIGAHCYALGAEAYLCVNTMTTQNLFWIIARAVQGYQLRHENRRLSQSLNRRLQQEHDEADRVLNQQQALIDDLETIQQQSDPESLAVPARRRKGLRTASHSEEPVARRPDLPDELIDHYRELLRTYVIMGSGNLACELSRLAELLVGAMVTARETMQLHLFALEEMVQGLGSRSTRHVVTRADLLILEIMIHLVEGYRRRYHQRTATDDQPMLSGFEMPPIARMG
jgi:DNA-binding NarL/FixJ family response regulator